MSRATNRLYQEKMTVRCAEARKLLSLRLDGPLTRPSAHWLAKHLSACGSCRHYDHLLGQLPAALGTAEELAVPPGFASSVMERLRASQAATPHRQEQTPTAHRALSAAALLALFTTLGWISSAAARYLAVPDGDLPTLAPRLIAVVLRAADTSLAVVDLIGSTLPLLLPQHVPLPTDSAGLFAIAFVVWALALWPSNRPRRTA
jgi:predicted anti-sigma-YlaC factor YlaD